MEWVKVADAVALLEKEGRDGTINRILKKLPATNHVPEYIGSISSMPAYRLVQNTTGLFRGKDERNFKTWRYTLQELVSFLAAFRASRAHDTIYAILGLASDFKPVHSSNSDPDSHTLEHKPSLRRRDTRANWSSSEEHFEVDYEQPVLAVFKKFLDSAIKKSKSLDIICRPWAPTHEINKKGESEKIDLPSWIANLSRKPYQPTKEGNMVRYNPDPLVGPHDFRHSLYSASGNKDMACKIDLVDDHSKTMGVIGFVLDEIEEIWDSAKFGSVPSDWLSAGNWKDIDKPPPDELWRTLVADRNAAGYDPDRWYPLVFQSVARDRGLSYGFETYRLIHETTNQWVSEVFRRVQAVVWNRRLIRTKGECMRWLPNSRNLDSPGALGLAPNEARKGDLICIIFGCSVPLVLRKVQEQQQNVRQSIIESLENDEAAVSLIRGTQRGNSETSTPTAHSQAEEEEYILIGECYVDHMMDGEALTCLDLETENSRPFTII
jgi:hypothetical protein